MTSLKPTSINKTYANKTIVLDTNVLVEGYLNPRPLTQLLQHLVDQNCVLTSLELIKLEFLSKNRSPNELSKKITFYNGILMVPELPSRSYDSEIKDIPLLYAFGKQCSNYKTVDFTIAAAMKKYAQNAILLTNDHHDFTPQLFNLVALLPLVTPSYVTSFGLYEFSFDKYAKLIET